MLGIDSEGFDILDDRNLFRLSNAVQAIEASGKNGIVTGSLKW